MKVFQAFRLLVIIILLSLVIGTSIAVTNYAKPGCNDMCGNVMIPYPFGIGSKCSVNEWYNVDCMISSSSWKPYLSALNNLEVLEVNLEQQTVTVNSSITSDCQNPVRDSTQILNVELDKSPFLFSRLQNKFVVEGCGNAVILDHEGLILTGCSTTCRNDTLSDKNNCLGISCCETTLPYYLKSYSVDLTALESLGSQNGACGSAFLVDEKSYLAGGFSSHSVSEDRSYVPVSLLWTLTYLDMYYEPCCNLSINSSLEVELANGTSIRSWKCDLFSEVPFEGNPYLSTGCQMILFTEQCARCSDSGRSCENVITYDLDGLADEWNITCISITSGDNHENKSSLGVILGVSVSMSILFLLAIGYILYIVFTKAKDIRRRERFFKRNGGLLLKQQEIADASLVDHKTILFTSHALEQATDNFNENRILGRGGQGTVYKGMLADGRIVAIKKSKIVDESRLEQFLNEVVVLSQVNHRNVVKLLGCCLETEVPLLVSEFISNGTLYDRIHDQAQEFKLSLNMRLQIATEVAGALYYLHSATSIPIYHRDIKTTNILLDDKYRAKVSDFGTSRFVSLDQTHLTTLVKGTFGYLDPEYFQSSQITEKSDVYSFGVVLAELLTGEKPISLTRFGEHRSLVMHFTLAMEEGRVMSIFDAMVIKEGTRDVLLRVASLAMHCLNENGMYRPTMKEVATELEAIRTAHIPTVVASKTAL